MYVHFRCWALNVDEIKYGNVSLAEESIVLVLHIVNLVCKRGFVCDGCKLLAK